MTRSLTQIGCVVALANLLLTGCQSLPTSGPSNGEITREAKEDQDKLGIHLVELSPAVVQMLQRQPVSSMSVVDRLRTNRAVDLLGPGDVISVSIYEAGNGLFGSRKGADSDTAAGSTAETLPRLQVDRNGMIMVPYAGEIHVAGLTMTNVQRAIESRLKDKTAQAQVVVTLISNGSNIVYISGDVHTPGRYSLSLAHENLLDIVALAGGPSHSPQDTLVKVNRGGKVATTSLTRVQNIPNENIPVEPQDRIQVDYLPRSYLSFGATGRVAQIPFDSTTVSLAEAVARVGGLDDSRANPEAVFLFRYERPGSAEALGLIPPGTAPASPAAIIPGSLPEGIPVIYQVNMRAPQTYFAIQQFAMQDKDVIYIANAPTVQVYKFLQLIYTLATPAVTVRSIAP